MEENDDLILHLPELPSTDENTVTECVKTLFDNAAYWCGVGSQALLCINPIEADDEIFGSQIAKMYALSASKTHSKPPHLFGIVTSAYYEMMQCNQRQVIAAIGSSGAGKTESVRRMLNYSLQIPILINCYGENEKKMQQTLEKISNNLHSSLFILDSFSNCSTSSNFNHSSIGCVSYEVGYDEYGFVNNLKISPFLLNFSRLTGDYCTADGHARNFHIFYYLLAGIPQNLREELELSPDPAQFRILKNGLYAHSEDIDDKEMIDQLILAMKNLKFSPILQEEIFCLLAAILFLGNIEFCYSKVQTKCGSSTAIKNKEALRLAANALLMDDESVEIALTQSIELRSNEKCAIFLSVEESEVKRNLIMQYLYESLFLAVLDCINTKFNSFTERPLVNTLVLIDSASFKKQSLVNNQQLYMGDLLEIMVTESFSNRWISQKTSIVANEDLDLKKSTDEDFNTLQKLFEAAESSCFSAGLHKKFKSNEDKDLVRICFSKNVYEVKLDPHSKDLTSDSIVENIKSFCKKSGILLLKKICAEEKNQGSAVFTNKIHLNHQNLTMKSFKCFFDDATSDPNSIKFLLNVKPNDTLDADLFDDSTVLNQLKNFKIDLVLQQQKSHFDSCLEITQFLAHYKAVFESLRLDPTVKNVNTMIQKLKIVPSSANYKGDHMFLSWNAIKTLHFYLQDNSLNSFWKPEALQINFSSQNAELNSILEANLQRQECLSESADFFSNFQTRASNFIGDPDEISTGAEYPGLIQYVENNAQLQPPKKNHETVSNIRRRWLSVTNFCTGTISDRMLIHFGKMENPEVRMAWREKVTLCIVIFILSFFMISYVTLFAKIICPTQKVMTVHEVRNYTQKTPHIIVFGKVYDMTSLLKIKPQAAMFATNHAGEDVSKDFLFRQRCHWTNPKKGCRGGARNCIDPEFLKRYFAADLGISANDVQAHDNPKDAYIVVNDRVYDITSVVIKNPKNNKGKIAKNLPSNLFSILNSPPYGTDRSKDFKYSGSARDLYCMEDFFVATLDKRNSFKCRFAEYILIFSTGIIVAIMAVKFVAALSFPTKRNPEQVDKYVMMQVPCYTEAEDSLRKTIDSLASLDYQDDKKLLFIICDGMLIGSGNDRPTPRIVLDILGVPASLDPEPKSYLSIADGTKYHNRAKVYSGLYKLRNHIVPFVVIAKVGTEDEQTKPGNRGKRDSQMILMNFLNKLYSNTEMSPLEIEIGHQIKYRIGVDPSMYEFILQVDADTEVFPDALTKLIASVNNDSKIIGLCGETEIGNEKTSLITMIQVYEYYISHYLAKAFESLFGSVTCLPGCFSLFKIKTTKDEPLIISDCILREYSDTNVNTLHKKNLLHLGEDRFLTTLLIKNFPQYKLCFTGDARCKTIVPDSWDVLLSQRRRWINSTIHNLFELLLVDQLCGFCFFSMKFVVMIDLFATLVMPATVVYLIFLIVMAIFKRTAPIISLIMLGLAYGMQAIIFLIKGQWQHIGWMILNFVAMPVFNFMIPLYSYWNFDDFSWGNTRRVVGDGKRNGASCLEEYEEAKFNPDSILKKKWSDHVFQIEKTPYRPHSAKDKGNVKLSNSANLTTRMPAIENLGITSAIPRVRTESALHEKRASAYISPSDPIFSTVQEDCLVENRFASPYLPPPQVQTQPSTIISNNPLDYSHTLGLYPASTNPSPRPKSVSAIKSQIRSILDQHIFLTRQQNLPLTKESMYQALIYNFGERFLAENYSLIEICIQESCFY